MKRNTLLHCMLLTVLLSMLPFARAAAANEAYAVFTDDDQTLTFYYDGNYGSRDGDKYRIGDYLNGRADRPDWWEPSGYSWHKTNNVKEVVFHSSFASVRPKTLKGLFAGLSNLKTITGMEDYLNTSAVMDMSSMFYGCSVLTDLDLSGFETYSVTNMSYMFYNCKKLTELDLSDFDTENVMDMSNMFDSCEKLETIALSGLNTENVTDMSNMFRNCSSLTNLDLSGLDAKKVTTMKYMFAECESLKNLNLSGFKTQNVTNMERMFNNCKSLKSLDLSSFDTRKVTNMLSIFCFCHSLESINLSGFDTRNLQNMSYMFMECKSLKSLDLRSFDTRNVTNMEAMFFDCSSLTSIDLSSFNTGNVTNMAAMFDACWALKNLDLSSFDTGNVLYLGSMFFGCRVLENLDLSNFDTGNVVDMSTMFLECWKLKSIDLSSFDTHKVIRMDDMFASCSSLTELDLSSFDMRKVSSTQSMFYSCKELKTIYVGNDWQLDSLTVEKSDNMFYGCISIVGGMGTTYTPYYNGNIPLEQNIYFAHVDGGRSNPGYLTRKNVAMPYAVLDDDVLHFYYDMNKSQRSGTVYSLNSGTGNPDWYTDHTCQDVSSVVFDVTFKDARPKSTYRWFAEMMSLSSITGIEYLNTSMVGTMYAMFWNCRAMRTLDLTGFNTEKVRDMSYMFYNCNQLTTINVGEAWTTENVTSSDDMFTGCTRIVGGAGTTYDLGYTDAGRAHADGGSANPGYLTLIAPYVAFNQSTGTLTFRCDGGRSSYATTYDLNKGTNDPKWKGIASSVKKVVFDESFAKARPTTTYNWFYNMSALTDITGMLNLNTSDVTNMEAMCMGCSSLTYFNTGYLDMRKVTTTSYMFSGCSSLKQLYVSGDQLNNLRNTSNMFNDCTALTTLDLSKFDVSKVTDMTAMFYGCTKLTKLDLSGFDTQNAESMFFMFNNCSSLTTLNLRDFDTRKVKYMSGMFMSCSALETIYVGSGWSMESVTNADRMFQFCYKLVGGAGTAYDGNHIDGSYAHVDGGESDPGYLSMMAYVAIEGETMTFCSDDFRNTHAVTYDLVTKYAWEDPAWLSDDNIGNVTNVYFTPSFAAVRPVTTSKWFYNMQKLQTVTGIEHLNTSRVEDMSSMFYFCKALKEIDLSHFDTRNVKDMYAMFAGCNALESLDVSNFNTEKVTNMSQMFGGCGFRSIDVGNFDTQNVTTMYAMFYGCPNLTVLDLNTFDTKKVSSWDSMFENSNQLKTIFVGKKWSTEGVSSGRWMFRYCYSLVGGAGTTYDDNMTGVTYARIDGGPSNPGYLTRNVHGDVNLDGQVGIGDIVATTNVMAGLEHNSVILGRADVNTDEQVGIGDIVAITNIMAGLYEDPDVYNAIDLGLPSGTKWCSKNVGADSPEDYGLYFAWGDTQGYTKDDGHTFYDETYRYYYFNGSFWTYDYDIGSDIAGTMYDAATANMDSNWKMPTLEQCQELIDNTTHESLEQNGVMGMKFTSKTNGKSIFIPASGDFFSGDAIQYAGSSGQLWLSTYDTSIGEPKKLTFSCSNNWVGTGITVRFYGQPVRAVTK